MRRASRFGALTFLLATAGPAVLAQGPDEQLKYLTVAPPNSNWPVAMSAFSIQRGASYPSVVELKGNVEITTRVCLRAKKKGELICDRGTTLRADEALFHEDTGAIEAHGNVVVTPLRESR